MSKDLLRICKGFAKDLLMICFANEMLMQSRFAFLRSGSVRKEGGRGLGLAGSLRTVPRQDLLPEIRT